MSIRKTSAYACLLAVLCTAGAAAETWRWQDETGQVHFGDKPPPGVAAERVHLRSKSAVSSDEASTQAVRERATAQDEAAREEQRTAGTEARTADETAMRRSRCDRARWALAALDSGRPVYRDASGAYRVKRPPPHGDTYSGPRQYLDEAEREAEIAHYQQEMNTYCAGFPELQDLERADEELRHAEACEAAALEFEQLMQDEARATDEEIARRRRFLDEECR